MPYAENEGVKIHYEVDGTPGKPTIVFQHGFLGRLQVWRDRGFVERVKDDFHVLLVDARGHGASDKPHEPEAYDMRARVLEITAVMDAEGVQQAHYHGYSMGGTIGWATMIYAPQRFLSWTIGGSMPMRDTTDAANRAAEDFDAYYAGALERNPLVKAADEAGLQDRAALKAAHTERAKWQGAEQAVRLAKGPILVYVGTEDKPHPGALRARELNPNLRVIELQGDDHGQAAQRPEIVVPAMLEMIQSVPVA